MTTRDPHVCLSGVSKTWREPGGERTVLRGVQLKLQTSEFVALRGPSGSGKSTLLNLLAAIDEPTSGDVIVGGRDVGRLGEPARTLYRRRHVGMVFQSFHLVPLLSVRENVTLPLELDGRRGAAVRQRALALLERVGLRDRADDVPGHLSGGEQQRVAIARAMVHGPELLLADEPTGNLDERHGQEVLELLNELRRESGRTILMATHSRSAAARCDRVFRIEHARLIEESVEPAR